MTALKKRSTRNTSTSTSNDEKEQNMMTNSNLNSNEQNSINPNPSNNEKEETAMMNESTNSNSINPSTSTSSECPWRDALACAIARQLVGVLAWQGGELKDHAERAKTAAYEIIKRTGISAKEAVDTVSGVYALQCEKVAHARVILAALPVQWKASIYEVAPTAVIQGWKAAQAYNAARHDTCGSLTLGCYRAWDELPPCMTKRECDFVAAYTQNGSPLAYSSELARKTGAVCGSFLAYSQDLSIRAISGYDAYIDVARCVDTPYDALESHDRDAVREAAQYTRLVKGLGHAVRELGAMMGLDQVTMMGCEDDALQAREKALAAAVVSPEKEAARKAAAEKAAARKAAAEKAAAQKAELESLFGF